MPIFDKLSALFNSPHKKREILFTAVENRNVPAIEGWLAREKDAASWKDDGGMTALMVASQYGHAQVIDMLLDAGADINARDNTGKSAMAHAASMGQQGIVKKLIGLGAETEGTYDVARRNGKTQIMQMIDDAASVKMEAKREQLGGRIEVMKPLSLRSFKPAA